MRASFGEIAGPSGMLSKRESEAMAKLFLSALKTPRMQSGRRCLPLAKRLPLTKRPSARSV
jgi:hypothetical protein